MNVTDLGHGIVSVKFETTSLLVRTLDALIAERGLPSREHALAYAVALTYQRACQEREAPAAARTIRRDSLAGPMNRQPLIDETLRAPSTSNVYPFPLRRA